MTALSAALALLPTFDGGYIPPAYPNDTVVCINPRLSRPTVYTADGKGITPQIGIVTEVHPELISILWDGYRAAWDYSPREVEGGTTIIARHIPARVRAGRRGFWQNAIAKDSAGWVCTDKGEWIAPEGLLS